MSQRCTAFALLALLSSSGFGCGADGPGDKDTVSDSRGGTLSVWPPSAGQGTAIELSVDATASILAFESTSVDLGAGIEVAGVEVDDGFGARAQLVIAADAELGARDVTITSDEQSYLLPDAFTVVAESLQIPRPAGAWARP